MFVPLLRLGVRGGVGSAVAMGAGTTAFAYVAWYACRSRMTATAAGSAQLVVPVLTAVGAVALLGERRSWTLVVAAVLVAAGMWLNRPGPTPARGSEEARRRPLGMLLASRDPSRRGRR